MVVPERWEKLDDLLGKILKDIGNTKVEDISYEEFIEMRSYFFKFFTVLSAFESLVKSYEYMNFKE